MTRFRLVCICHWCKRAFPNRAALGGALRRGTRGFPQFDGGKCLATARVAIESLQIALLKGVPVTVRVGRAPASPAGLQGDAARTGVNDHEPMTVRPDLIEF